MKVLKKILPFGLILCMMFTFVSCGEKDLTDYVAKLGQYKGLELEKVNVEVTDEDLQKAIENDLEGNATVVEVTDCGVKDGDSATIDFAGYIDGEQFEGGTATDYPIEVGTTNMIDGFVEGIIGLKTGESVSLDLKFPDDYHNTDVAGKDVKFDITVKKIQESIIPEYNEEFCKKLGYDNVEDYETNLEAELMQQKIETAQNKKQNDAWTQILQSTEIKEYPKSLIDDYVNSSKEELEGYAEMLSISFEELLGTYYQVTLEEYNEIILEEAQNYVKEKIVITTIAKKEGFVITQDEYTAGVSSYAEAYGQTTSEFEEYYGNEIIKESLLWNKIVNFVVENSVEK